MHSLENIHNGLLKSKDRYSNRKQCGPTTGPDTHFFRAVVAGRWPCEAPLPLTCTGDRDC